MELTAIGGWQLPSAAKAAAIMLGAAVLFGLLAYGSITLSRGDGRIAVVWIPNALALVALIHFRFRHEWLVMASMFGGNLAANLSVGDPLMAACGLSLANSVEIALSLWLVRRTCGAAPDMTDIGQLGRFVFCAGLVGPFVSATIAATMLSYQGSAFAAVFVKWLTTDGLGMVIIAPAMLIFARALANFRRPTRKKLVDWLALTTLGTAFTVLIFWQTTYPLLFLIAPVVIIHAFKLGSLGTAFSVINVGCIAMLFTWLGVGPINIAGLADETRWITLQAFLASSFIIGLPVAAMLESRDRMIAELAERETQLSLLTHNITDAIMRYDTAGTCIYASPSVETVLARPAESFVGQLASAKTHEMASNAIAEVEKRLVEGNSERERLTYRRLLDDEDGNAVYIEADCAISYDPATGNRDGTIVSARDVTERVQLEHELVRARKHAEDAAHAKSQFLANMSHEIRTPMNGVLGFAELLLQTPLDEEQQRHAELIVESGRSMMLLLNDILDISKIEAGQIVVIEEPVQVRHLLDGCLRLHRSRAIQKDIALALEVDDTIPEFIVGDALRLRQVMLNLIGNAVKFTQSGSVTVTAQRRGEQIEIDVKDTGIGIDENLLDKIFQPFEQADGAISRQFGGTGLGLTISRQLAELLGGTLTARSAPKSGSQFTLALPLVVAADAQAAPLLEEGPGEHSAPVGGRILLVEDHDVNRMLATAMLERCGQNVTCAHDGTEAIAILTKESSGGSQFDLVLMDIQMPGCDGYTATRAIREAGIKPEDLPIVAMTANAFPEDVAAAKAAGMQAHLAKPVVYSELCEALARWLPVRIVDNAEAPAEPNEPQQQQIQSKALAERWQKRRGEALDAVSGAIAQGQLAETEIEDLARIVHKLAGTAGMFGEEELGECARNLERALKSGVPESVSMRLAHELLDAA